MNIYTKNTYYNTLSNDLIYQNYHKHTMYTNVLIVDSASYPEEYAKRAVELKHGLISSCEHGYQGRYIESFQMAEKYNLKYLFAVEAYFVYDRFESDNTNAHMVLMAKNENGRKAINRILSEANLTGFYYRARIDYELLMTLPEKDVWITTACIGGINKYTRENMKSEKLMKWWFQNQQYESPYEMLVDKIHQKFQDNFFLEVQAHHTTPQFLANQKMIEYSKIYGIEIIAGVDSHYIDEEDAWKRDYLQKSSGIFMDEESGWFMDYPDGKTLFNRFKKQGVLSEDEIKVAISNTNIFLEVEEYTSPIFNHEMKMPSAPKYQKMTKEEKQIELMKIVRKRWDEVKNEIPEEKHGQYMKEIAKELDIIFKIDHADYFLLNYEIIKDSVENRGGMITFSGRGCAVSGVLIPTETTLKTIENVKKGDKVISDDGKFHKVLETFKYDIDEELIQIVHEYGTNTHNPLIYTTDHKILIHRNNYNQWISAENLTNQDYVCVPKMKLDNQSMEYIDLNKYNIYGFDYDDEYIYEYNSNIGKSYKYSPSDVAKHIGCGKTLIENLANGKINDIGTRKREIKNKFFEYVPFNTFIEYQEYIKNIRTKKIKRFIKNDYNYNVFIGLLYGDGCHREDKHTISLAINSVTEKDKVNRSYFEQFCNDMGFDIYELKSKNKKLVQLCFTSLLYSEYMKQELFSSNKNNEKMFNYKFFYQDNNNLKGLKYGLWLSDGSDKDERISFDNTSMSLINAYKILSMICEDCGVCSISKRITHIDSRGYHNKDSYKIRYPKNPFVTGSGHHAILQDNNFWYLKIKEIKRLPKQKISVYDITVEDTHNYLANNMIAHNSGPSFYVNHLLGFTQIDRISSPITLYPERFLSTSRMSAGSLADIDFNCGNTPVFEESQKDILGENHAYPMIAYGKLKPKAAWKMYCRAVDVPFEISNEISSKIDEYESDLKYWDEESGEEEPNVLDYIPEELQNYFNRSKEFLGLIDHASRHPCGNILLTQDIKEEVGIVRLKSKGGRETICAVLDGLWCEKYLMLKNDLLTVTCVRLVYDLYKRINLPYMSLNKLLEEVKDHPEVWNMYEKGYVVGLNQVEKNSTKRKVMKYKPKNISELSAFIAGIRPAFKSLVDKLINREHFEYGIPTLDNLLQTEELPESFILYQEQIMKILAFAGIPMGDCYTVIKSISKKRFENIMHYKEQFLTGMAQKLIEAEQIDEVRANEVSNTIWKIIEDASAYGFNSSHSLSVSFDSLLAAYFKALYPLEFYEVYLNLQMEKAKKDKAFLAQQEMKEAFNINLLPMKFGQDNRKYTAYPEQNAISTCMKSIKGFGDIVGKELYRLGQHKFNTFIDLLIAREKYVELYPVEVWTDYLKDNIVDEKISQKILKCLVFFDNNKNNPEVLIDKSPLNLENVFSLESDDNISQEQLYSEFAKSKELWKIKVNDTQMQILIKLGYFDQYGRNAKILQTFNLFCNWYGKKVVKKEKLHELDLNIDVFMKYVGKETKCQYSDINFEKYIKEISDGYENKYIDLLTQLKFERELFEIPVYRNEEMPETWCYVMSFKTYGDKVNTPYLILYNLHTGNLFNCSINKSKIFKESPFGIYSIIDAKKIEDVPKKKKVGEKQWVVTNEMKTILNYYEVIKRNKDEEINEVLKES